MMRRAPSIPVAIAFIVGCNGNCSENAVFVTQQAQQFGSVIDTIEVYSDTNRDGDVGPSNLSERGFVVDPAPGVPKILRIKFLIPQKRARLFAGDINAPAFLDFSSFVLPAPAGSNWVEDMYFEDDPSDRDTGVECTSVVTYVLHDNLVSSLLATNAMPVTVTMGLDQLNEPACGRDQPQDLDPLKFPFVLARLLGIGETHRPPRIVQASPTPFPFLPGWGRPIDQSDFAGGQTLDQVLNTADKNFKGATLFQRVAPHEVVSFTFDKPIVNMVASVSPFPPMPTSLDPAGIALEAPTIGFLTAFKQATSQTGIGMAPDQVYEIGVLSDSALAFAPVWRGTQSDQGEYVIANFDNATYDLLRMQGYSNADLSGHSIYKFRTGPFRITSPVHLGSTNARTAPDGRITARLQFAEPAEGIAAPTSVTATISPAGLGTTTSSLAFPPGTPDTIRQDGCIRASGTVDGPNNATNLCALSPNITSHDIPLQLPDRDFDDIVEIDLAAFSGPSLSDLLGHDKIRIHHDVIVPTIDSSVQITNTYPDGQLDEVCITADCDVSSFEVSATPPPVTRCIRRPPPFPPPSCPSGLTCNADANCVSVVSTSEATTSSCVNNRQQYCFKRLSMGLPSGTTEDGQDVTFIAVDDQGNRSLAVTAHTRPPCQVFDKFVGAGGQSSAVATGPDALPRVAFVDGAVLRYAVATSTGAWTVQQITGIAGSTGLGIDMVLDPTDQQPVVCFVDAPDGPVQSTVGTLRVMKLSGTAWTELSHTGNVRPYGCSLSTLGTRVIVGWSEPGLARWGLAEGVGFLSPVLPQPPQGLERANDELWDVDIAGHDGRVYFAYRTANDQTTSPRAPGSIVVGYDDPGAKHVQTVLECSHDCGFGPQLIADEFGVALAYVTQPTFGDGELEVRLRWGDAPAVGADIDMNHFFVPPDHDELTALSNLTHRKCVGGDNAGDDCTHDSACAHGSCEYVVAAAPFGRPAVVRARGQNVLVLAWARGGLISQQPEWLGTEDVAVANINAITGNHAFAIVDRRIATNSHWRDERIDLHMSMGPEGYSMIYRNPAANRLSFRAEQETTAITSPVGIFSCPGLWQTSTIPEDVLNLKYQVDDTLWATDCAGTNRAPPRPTSAVFGNPTAGLEVVAEEDATLLQDLAKGIVLRNGQVPQRKQTNVCIPRDEATGQPDFFMCDPLYTLVFGIRQPLPTLSCVTGAHSCMSNADCCSGQCNGHLCTPTGTMNGCPAPSTVEGVMPWVALVDNVSCSRCPDGAAPHACRTNDDCLIFGGSSANDGRNSAARCSDLGVCVPRCHDNFDCTAPARCDLSNEKDPGVCRDVFSGKELPAGTNLLCRPLGCDTCWKNDYCTDVDGSSDCPPNHVCYAGAAKAETPACILRPILAPKQTALAGLTQAQLDELETARLGAQALFSTIQVPFVFPSDYFDCETTAFDSEVEDIHVSIVDSLVDVKLTMSEAHIRVCHNTPRDFTTDGDWAIHLKYAPFVSPRVTSGTDSKNAYSGVSFTFIGLSVDGCVEIGPFCASLGAASATLEKHMGEFADKIMTTILATAGNLRADSNNLLTLPGITRCMVAPQGIPMALPHQCPSKKMQDIWTVATEGTGMTVRYEACMGP